jgi:hypothetical protein
MPAGCDFICENEKCSYQHTGFVITAPWPMGRIELVINSVLAKKVPSFREKLIAYKNEGRKLALIQYPDQDDIPILAYRVNMWSPQAKCIWQYDVELNNKNFEEAVSEAFSTNYIPKICPKTGCNLLTFNEVVEKGIICPSCQLPLEQCRWFANER